MWTGTRWTSKRYLKKNGMNGTEVAEGLKARTRLTITRCMITRWMRMRGKWTTWTRWTLHSPDLGGRMDKGERFE